MSKHGNTNAMASDVTSLELCASMVITELTAIAVPSLVQHNPLPNHYAGKGSGDMAIPKLFCYLI